MASPCLYVDGIRSTRQRARELKPEELVIRMLASYGTSQLYEWLRAVNIGKVMFDVGASAATSSPGALLTRALAGVHTFFGFMPSRVLIAASHGGDKLSYRIIIAGFRMKLGDVKKRIVRLGLNADNPFDGHVYGSNQKLRMVGSIKTAGDARPLVLIDAQQREVAPTEALLTDTLVQVVEGAWPLLEEP